MMRQKDMRVGLRVLIPWGDQMVEATVVELVGTPERGHVRIMVHLPGLEEDDDEPIIPSPAEWLIEPSAA